MMRIMFFGDSNTWGYRPDNGLRYAINERFTGILKQKLPDDEIIEEGLNGRTFVLHDPYCDYASGEAALPYLLKSHMPLDLIVIMLGTNDLKHQFQLSAEVISRGAKVLIRMIKNPYLNEKYPVPKILLVSPIHLHEKIGQLEGSWFDYGKEEYEKSTHLAKYLKEIAEAYDCEFMDASKFAKASSIDGMHMEKEDHALLAQAFKEKINEIRDR